MIDQLLHRRRVLAVLGLESIASLAACARDDEKCRTYSVLNAEMFSNLDRPLSDIMFNGMDLGVTNKYGCTGVITGLGILFGA